MAGNEKYKNPDIEIKDGFTQISENLAVIFYYKEPQPSLTEIYLEYLRDMSKIVLGMSTKENSPEEIVRTIVDAVKKNPDIFYLVPIVYNTSDEKTVIALSLCRSLGLKENEVFKKR